MTDQYVLESHKRSQIRCRQCCKRMRFLHFTRCYQCMLPVFVSRSKKGWQSRKQLKRSRIAWLSEQTIENTVTKS